MRADDSPRSGFKGQARVILPTITSCYECSLDMLTPPTAFPICTIANTPRLPEHCIEWASILEWPRVFKGELHCPSAMRCDAMRRARADARARYTDKKLDNDDPEHIQWLFDTARTRAEQYNIEGVTWSLTQGVVKRIIPAIASTNAIISGESPYTVPEEPPADLFCQLTAACCNEAFKMATSSNPYLSNYMYVSSLSSPIRSR